MKAHHHHRWPMPIRSNASMPATWLTHRPGVGSGKGSRARRVTAASGLVAGNGSHRFAYTLRHGPIPEGLNVLHGCDNRRCYNWDHLRVGTQRDNAQDAKERDRLRIGPGSNPRKLTGRDAVAIQGMRWFEKLTLPQLAEAFNVSVWTIKAVLSGKARVAAAEAHIDAVLAAKAEARARAAPETTEAETVP